MTVFISKKKKGFIDLMDVKGSLNTTEVGVFFTESEAGKTKLEIVSLSAHAQLITSDIIFANLSKTYSEVK